LHLIDILLIAGFFVGMLVYGFSLKESSKTVDEHFVGKRDMGAGKIGLSVVATDVGGGFSIGLGGLGFAMGLSGSWLLFTGLLGAWLAAVLLIPKVKPLSDRLGMLTFPDLLAHRFGERCRTVAAVVSALGYAGFVGSQMLAGGKLSAAAFGIPLHVAVLVMCVVIVLYTAMGGMKAVIMTDVVQWGILLGGLALIALPLSYQAVGGWSGLQAALPAEHFSFTNLTPATFATWLVTIVPVWFVGMTLYQRIFAARDVKTAQRAWLLAGLLEWPVIALLGTVLGMMARVLFPAVEAEMGLPMLIREVLPVGAMGLVVAAYFSAIMSTADSCLLASVGNLVHDLYRRVRPEASHASLIRLSRTLTYVVGFGSVGFALLIPRVLDSIVVAYSFMVAGLFFPTLAALYWKRATASGAFWSMVLGGGVTVVGTFYPPLVGGVEPIFVGLPVSAVVLVALSLMTQQDPEPALGA
jgi:SSS family solute:Na+ symporter